MFVKVVLHVGKGAKFGVEKVNGGQNICSRYASVGNGKNFEKQAQSSKGYFNLNPKLGQNSPILMLAVMLINFTSKFQLDFFSQ